MERLSEGPVPASRLVRRKSELTDGPQLFNTSSDRLLTWRSVFQRKAEFEKLIEHRMEHSAIRLLPAVPPSTGVLGRDRAGRTRHFSANRALGQPRSAIPLSVTEMQTTSLTIPAKVTAVDLTCLGITNAILTSPITARRNGFSRERFGHIKRANSDVSSRTKYSVSCLEPSVPCRFTFQRKGKGSRTDTVSKDIDSARKESTDTIGILQDAIERNSKNIKPTPSQPASARNASRVEAAQKPLCERTRAKSAERRSEGKSILKRIKEKLESDWGSHAKNKQPVEKVTRDFSFDGINNKLNVGNQKPKLLPVEKKRRKSYRLFGTASSKSGRRSVRFSVEDTIYEYDSET